MYHGATKSGCLESIALRFGETRRVLSADGESHNRRGPRVSPMKCVMMDRIVRMGALYSGRLPISHDRRIANSFIAAV
jgi:hypothetical protein